MNYEEPLCARWRCHDRPVSDCAARTTALRVNAKFCDECGSPPAASAQAAEYKQATVLFADVVHSMDVAAAVGAVRLREIMTQLVDRASVVVKRYGGTVDKFTGDGVMALFWRTSSAGGPCFPRMFGGVGYSGGSQALSRRSRTSGRGHVAAASRVELG